MDLKQIESLKKQLLLFGQEHLLQFWNKISDDEKNKLCEELSNIQFDHVNKSFEQCKKDIENLLSVDSNKLEPLPSEVFGSSVECSEEQLKKLKEIGLKKIGEGKVAALLMAGGQGTRLGVKYPKGMYNVGLPSQKTLFQLMAERLITLQQLASSFSSSNCIIPWYIMTSEATKADTVKYFEDNKFFGLENNQVVFFNQANMPCVTFEGKIILKSPSSLAKSPNGNGGVYSALDEQGILKNMAKRGIEIVHAFCVDNILLKIADPIFIGFMLSKGSECGYKVVQKTDPSEPVGVLVKYKGEFRVVEYSELTKEASEKRDEEGRLVFRAGGIANHLFTLDFLKKISKQELNYHVAKKKIPYSGEDGKTINPEKPNGIKMEKFIFDVFPYTQKVAVWEVKREDEFSPLKNSDSAGKDCPSTSRDSLFKLHRKWILNAGGSFHPDSNDSICEISPLLSYNGEGLEKEVKGKDFSSPTHLKAPCEQ